jgi:hypothetical protein
VARKKIPFQTPSDLRELILQVSARPAMFVGVANFDLALAFIGGFHYALSILKPDAADPKELNEFSIWLAEKFGLPRNWAWSAVLRRVYPNDEEAFKQLPLLYDEFKSKPSDD